ncbi:MAG: hypothetical protein ABR987_02230 [Terracidiphilus sp.]|jgi:hypothetical protein
MKRVLSISLILLFGFGPLAALPGSEESRLPPCCRRHGNHHCAMMQRMAQAASGKPIVTAPATCPLFPGYGIPTTASIDALAAAPASLPVLLAQAHVPAAGRSAAWLSPIRSRAGRSPPAKTLG